MKIAYNKFHLDVLAFLTSLLMGFCICASEMEIEKEDNFHVLKSIEKKENNTEFHVLFLCAGNATRSQLAEGWLKHLGGSSVKAMSAGISPRTLNPKAIQVMKESGIDIQDQTSKKLVNDMLEWADLVITTCDISDKQCPVLPKNTNKIHWSITNSVIDFSNEEEVLKQVRTTSEEIHFYVLKLLSKLKEFNHIN